MHIQEFKAGTCDVLPGRRPRGGEVLDLIDAYRVRGGVTMASGAVAVTADLLDRDGPDRGRPRRGRGGHVGSRPRGQEQVEKVLERPPRRPVPAGSAAAERCRPGGARRRPRQGLDRRNELMARPGRPGEQPLRPPRRPRARRRVRGAAAAQGVLHRHLRVHRLQGLRGGVQGVERGAGGRHRPARHVLRQHRRPRGGLVAGGGVHRAVPPDREPDAPPTPGRRRGSRPSSCSRSPCAAGFDAFAEASRLGTGVPGGHPVADGAHENAGGAVRAGGCGERRREPRGRPGRRRSPGSSSGCRGCWRPPRCPTATAARTSAG